MQWFLRIIFFIAVFITGTATNAQLELYPGKYLLQFNDKNNTPYYVDQPEKFLSKRAIKRRIKQGIQIVENDLPVNPVYVDSLRKLGFMILNKSKWLNAVTVFSTDSLLLDTITNLSFIKKSFKQPFHYKQEKSGCPYPFNKKTTTSMIKIMHVDCKKSDYFNYGESANQIKMLNGHVLHNMDYCGQGMQIAILDAGFFKVPRLQAFDSIYSDKQILGVYDYVDNDDKVYNSDYHGMKVFSTIAANLPGKLIGTAPKATYWLLRTEDSSTEYRIEEANWVAAAEYADSAGADIINTSLGYDEFDDTTQNHTYLDMDGNSTIISIAADIAASKGMIVVASAGNDGAKDWKYISAPADADSILTVGSVDYAGSYSYFSSKGPTTDNRVKPNIMAMGFNTTVQSPWDYISNAYGTSFSAPIISGMVACLWQVNPNLTNMEVIKLIEQSSSNFLSPDSLTGYGIPDFAKAYLFAVNTVLSENYLPVFMKKIHPPMIDFTNHNTDLTYTIPAEFSAKLFDTAHNLILNISTDNHTLLGNFIKQISHGVYYMKINNKDYTFHVRLIL